MKTSSFFYFFLLKVTIVGVLNGLLWAVYIFTKFCFIFGTGENTGDYFPWFERTVSNHPIAAGILSLCSIISIINFAIAEKKGII